MHMHSAKLFDSGARETYLNRLTTHFCTLAWDKIFCRIINCINPFLQGKYALTHDIKTQSKDAKTLRNADGQTILCDTNIVLDYLV